MITTGADPFLLQLRLELVDLLMRYSDPSSGSMSRPAFVSYSVL